MTLEEAKKRLMTEEGFRKAYEELEEEYKNIKASIESETSTEELTDEQIYQLQSSERDYCEMYEPTYNPEDGSM